jgi:hypothetical protein
MAQSTGSRERFAAQEQELRATSDELLLAAEQIIALENAKRSLDVGSAGFRELAGELEERAADLLGVATRERELGDAVAMTEPATNGVRVHAIDPHPALQDVLARWRAAERAIEAAAPGTLEKVRASAVAARLRAEYAQVFADLTSHEARQIDD